MIHRYGDIPVPWTVMWSAEEEYFVGECPIWHKPAICQHDHQGEGVPRFGQPHTMRQRKALAFGLCDICGKSLRNSTKFSLSNVGGLFDESHVITHVEPLLHKDCARLSLAHCPSLRRQMAEGRLAVRQVFRYRARPTEADADEKGRYAPGYDGALIGLAVLDLLSWCPMEMRL